MSYLKSIVDWSYNPMANLSRSDLCEVCRKKPKYIDIAKGVKHPYCSRTCARGRMPFPGTGDRFRAAGRPAKANFYSDTHGKHAVRLGHVAGPEWCEVQPRSNVGSLCVACDRSARAALPKLRQLRPGSTMFKDLRARFRNEWEVISTLPTVEKVYDIQYSPDIRKIYENYQNDHPDKICIPTFHAAQCICDMGTQSASLCDFKSCGICSIVKSSFKKFAFGERFNVGRFGKGIYVYRDPSIADRHATSCTSSPYRVMIVCNTLVDRNQLDEADDRESIFIDCVDAINPAYIVMYCKPQQCSTTTSQPDSRSEQSRHRSHVKSVKGYDEDQTFFKDTLALASDRGLRRPRSV